MDAGAESGKITVDLRGGALAAASGLLVVAAFPPFNVEPLAWIALVPLLLALDGRSAGAGFLLSGITGLVSFVGTIYWVTNSLHVYGNIPIVPASLVTLLLCAYLALYPALFGAATILLKARHPGLVFLTAPCLWTALELARTYVFSGFPWSLLGYTQYLALPVIQISDVTGVYGVSFLIVMVNTALAEFISDRRRYRAVLFSLLVLALALGYGWAKLRVPERAGGITVAVVQGNIEQDKKWDPAYQSDVTATYRRLTAEALARHPDLVIWPETSTPFYFNGDNPADRARSADLVRFVKRAEVPLLFGSPTCERKPRGAYRLRNSAFLLSREGAVEAEYRKIHLVPFGEYVPLKRALFFVEKMVQASGDFQPGEEYTVMTVRRAGTETRLCAVICYEIVLPDLVRRFVKNGAGVVTTITNDAWFGRTAAPYQHFSMAIFRAVENRVPIARAANTGVSGFIDANGRILETSGIFTEAYLTHTITPGTEQTFYTKYGDLFSYACVLAGLVLVVKLPNARRDKRTR